MNPPDTSRYLEPRRRSLSASERRLLTLRARDARRRAESYKKMLFLMVGVVGALWILTLLASEAVWWAITLFWMAAGTVLLLWMRSDARTENRHLVAVAQQLDSALSSDGAEVYDFRSRAYIEFEEVEDEGACYAFDLRENGIAFVVGQEFYAEARFPSLDFSLVYPLDSEGKPVHMVIEKRGSKAGPVRVVPAGVKLELEMPEHLQVVSGDLEQVEEVLRRQPRSM